ncbi:hypothetical protein BAZSYMA_ACONTIG38414_1 [Bathymodiolus azoricus thioautotrophic gill symbiont]|uniref:Uncharacterized protein n=1 Tax=Bathymodiolus azoricus thioautotrophic gill symbiont TaxID=235205 RepID=A0A1H6KTD5_9GAMM|nr:hypothetical protein BAZSYMA_ACONTIG38414_1 [Bathymodiolus azoricus thioautotrophic gill symbiont]
MLIFCVFLRWIFLVLIMILVGIITHSTDLILAPLPPLKAMAQL